MSSRLFRNTFLYIFTGFLPVAANFFLAPIYAKYLSPEQYALVGLSTLVQAFLTFFMSLSLDSAFTRMYFKYERKPRLRTGLLSTLLFVSVIASLIISLILYFKGDELFRIVFSVSAFRFSDFGYWITIITFCNVAYTFFILYYRNADKIRYYFLLNVLFFFIPVSGTLAGLIFFKQGPLGAIAGRAIGCLIVMLPIILLFWIKTRFSVIKAFIYPALKYSLPIIPYQLIFAGFLYLDRFFLLHYFSPYVFGVYNFAALLSGLIPVFLNALANATNPAIYRELTKNNDLEKVQRYNHMIVFASMAVICTCIAFVVPAMRLLISSNYADSYFYVGLLFLSYLPYVHYLVFSLPLFFWGKTRSFPIIAIFSLLAGLIFNFIMIRHIGIWAVCLSLFCIRATQLLTAYLFNRKFGYEKLQYVKQSKFICISFCICVLYATALFVNNRYKFLPVDLINLIPVTGLIIVIPLISKREITAIKNICVQLLEKYGFSKIILHRK